MKFRIAYPVALAALTLLMGCGSLKRAGKDIAVVLTSPATVPLNAAYDTMDWGEYTNTATPVVLSPFNGILHLVKHVGYTTIYAMDLLASPFYVLASITDRNDLEPIDLYSFDHGYPWKSAPVPALEE